MALDRVLALGLGLRIKMALVQRENSWASITDRSYRGILENMAVWCARYTHVRVIDTAVGISQREGGILQRQICHQIVVYIANRDGNPSVPGTIGSPACSSCWHMYFILYIYSIAFFCWLVTNIKYKFRVCPPYCEWYNHFSIVISPSIGSYLTLHRPRRRCRACCVILCSLLNQPKLLSQYIYIFLISTFKNHVGRIFFTRKIVSLDGETVDCVSFPIERVYIP